MSEEKAILFLGALIGIPVLAIFMWVSYERCESQSISFSANSWGPIQGCMVKHNGRWLPLENIRGFDDKG